jgi:hypothetical protein
MNTNDAAVDTTSSAMAMSRQHETTPMMQELGRSLSELGPLGNHETSSSPEATGPQNDPACGIMKITPVEVAVSACFICPIFFISLCTLLPCKCFRRYMASLNFYVCHAVLVYLELSGISSKGYMLFEATYVDHCIHDRDVISTNYQSVFGMVADRLRLLVFVRCKCWNH